MSVYGGDCSREVEDSDLMAFFPSRDRMAQQDRKEFQMTDEEIAELHKHRDDPDEWEDEPIEMVVSKPVGNVVSFQLPTSELDRAIAAADELGISLSEFIHDALEQRIGDTAAVSAV